MTPFMTRPARVRLSTIANDSSRLNGPGFLCLPPFRVSGVLITSPDLIVMPPNMAILIAATMAITIAIFLGHTRKRAIVSVTYICKRRIMPSYQRVTHFGRGRSNFLP